MFEFSHGSMPELLERIVSARRPELLLLVHVLKTAGLTQEQRESLRGVIADELSEAGLGDNDEPNSYGLVLEDLIDWLGHR